MKNLTILFLYASGLSEAIGGIAVWLNKTEVAGPFLLAAGIALFVSAMVELA